MYMYMAVAVMINTTGTSNRHVVVQPRQYQAARQSERQFGGQKMADVPYGLDMIVARPGLAWSVEDIRHIKLFAAVYY